MKDALVAGHAAGKSLTQIAAEIGYDPGALSRRADKLGLSWDTSQVAAANIARHDRARERRLTNIERLQTLNERLMTQAELPQWPHLVRDNTGEEVVRDLDFIPAQAARDITQAAKNVLQTMAQLEAVDADAGLARAKSLVSDLAAGLGVLPMEPDQ